MRSRTVWASSLLCGITTAVTFDTGFNSTWDDERWRLHTSTLIQGQYQSRMSLANGYLGINVAALGPFFEVDSGADLVNEWPLFDRRQTFATVAGFYDYQPVTNSSNFPWLSQYGGESVISGIPHWSGLHIKCGDDLLQAGTNRAQIRHFKSTLDVRRGLMKWKYTWHPSESCALDIQYVMFVNKRRVNQAAIRLKVTSHRDVQVSVIDVLHGDSAVRADTVRTFYDDDAPSISTAVSPIGVADVAAHIHSTIRINQPCQIVKRSRVMDESIIGGNMSSIGQSFDLGLQAKTSLTIDKYIGVASTDAFADPDQVAKNAVLSALGSRWHDSLSAHTREWASILTPDSVDSFRYDNGSLPDDENIREVQVSSILNSYYILQNTIGQNAIIEAGNDTALDVNSIPVCGLGDSCYGGEIFWDSEVWIAPGLVVTNPQSMKQVAKYRVEKYRQAQENIKSVYQSSQADRSFSKNGAIFPWISSRYGNCTAVGPCWDYEYHVNGDIGLEFYNYLVSSGDVEYFKSDLMPIYESITQLYVDLLEYNETTQRYDLLNATDPDEFANSKNNVAYTMALIGSHLNNTNALREYFGREPNDTFTEIARKVNIPVNEETGIFEEYTGMNGSISVKQADVVLIDDFLEFPNPYSLSNLDFYAGKQSQDGPAMTYGVFSIVANAFSPSGCSAYTYDLYGSKPYLRAPWLQFSEQLIDDHAITGFHPGFPFLTGMGGALRVAVFGYLGLHLRLTSFHIDPALPPQIPHIRFRTIYWLGWPIKASSDRTHTVLTRDSSNPLETANMTFARSGIPVTVGSSNTPFILYPNSSLIIENRQNGWNKTLPGNISQCRPVKSRDAYIEGQFPLGAVDGALSTQWQPKFLNQTSSITIDLGHSFSLIKSIHFNWARFVPDSFNVTFSNDTTDSGDVSRAASSNTIEISQPYDPENAAIIMPYVGNSTDVELDPPVWSGRYATLYILGNQALRGTRDEKNGTGATVAEFALIAA